jgi:hypothetical protein
MRSRNVVLPTILHAVSPRRGLAAVLALVTILIAGPGAGDAQAGGFGYRSHGSSFRGMPHGKTTTHDATSHKAMSSGRFKRNKSSYPRTEGATGKSKGSKVVKTDPYRPGGEGKPPRHPRHPHYPHHPRHPHGPPVIVTIPSGPGVVVDGGGNGGPPNTVISNVSNGGGGGSSGSPVTRRGGSGLPPANERRYVPNEVVLELAPGITANAAEAIARRHRLVRLESFTSRLGGTTLARWRIPDRRSVPAVIRALQADSAVISVQPNYLSLLADDAPAAATVGRGDPAQYALAKLHMPQAHALATGTNVLIAVVDSGIDTRHPELAGMIADSYDAIGSGDQVHAHGTGIAGAIVAHAKLMGTAPAARILAIRSFGQKKDNSEGTTFNISKGLNWAVEHDARVINMSFAGPRDPAIERDLDAAHAKGIVLIAAAGNAGPKSAPLYPAANPNVIAVTATDEDDNLFSAANRGKHIAVAAPGVDIYLPAPGGIYQMTSGTSFAAAEVSGAVALLLQRRPDLAPTGVRKALMSTARDLGPDGIDTRFGAGLVDAYKALISLDPAPAATAKR